MLYRAGPSPSLLNLKLTSEAMPGIKIQKNIFFVQMCQRYITKKTSKQLAPKKKSILEISLPDLPKTLNRSCFWTHIRDKAKLFWQR